MVLASGIGVLLYFLLWLVLPDAAESPTRAANNADLLAQRGQQMGVELREAISGENHRGRLFIGGGLVALGLYFFLDNLNLWWLRWINFNYLWPLLLVAVGVYLILRQTRAHQADVPAAQTEAPIEKPQPGQVVEPRADTPSQTRGA